jgi:aspartyl-tRNA(Asn)/glutamyl-tRNA(Gln) amidotransferase subunit B
MTLRPVIGLEIHVGLATRTRLFSPCPVAPDTSVAPNHLTDPVTLGLPGTLPVLNRRAVELGVRMGLALDGIIAPESRFDRKHYFYPDLPRNFQITQHGHPLVTGGRIEFETGGRRRELPLIQCHLEDDAARSVHGHAETRVDGNRAGVALLEIVTEPALHDPADAAAAVDAVRELARWLGCGEANLEEGQMRCDANVSLEDRESDRVSARVELKNLNSIRGVARALETEIGRLGRDLEAGSAGRAQTRGWDAERGRSYAQRGKEEVVDYRFLPEPDLGPLRLDPAWIEARRDELPELPVPLRRRWRRSGMRDEAARVLSASRERARWVDSILEHGVPAEFLGNWASTDLLRRARERQVDLDGLPWERDELVRLMLEVAESRRGMAEARGLLDESAEGDLAAARQRARLQADVAELDLAGLFAEFPEQVAAYRAGKRGLLGWFVARAKDRWPEAKDPAELAAAIRRALDGEEA